MLLNLDFVFFQVLIFQLFGHKYFIFIFWTQAAVSCFPQVSLRINKTKMYNCFIFFIFFVMQFFLFYEIAVVIGSRLIKYVRRHCRILSCSSVCHRVSAVDNSLSSFKHLNEFCSTSRSKIWFSSVYIFSCLLWHQALPSPSSALKCTRFKR